MPTKGTTNIMNNNNNEQYRFKVNLGGMIEILSDHLYSSPDVYIRELLQNGVDAIVAREKTDETYKHMQSGCIKINITEGKSLTFEDNGLGLTEEEIHSFLAIIGQSSKKDLESGKIFSDFIGRFGIGLLSYFMVSDKIRIHTRSIHSDIGYEWIGTPDGLYTISEIDKEDFGTQIFLEAKEGCEQYFTSKKIQDLIMHFGLILPYPILLNDGVTKQRINPVFLPWQNKNSTKAEIMAFGELIFKQQFLDCVVFSSENGDLEGVAYIVPYAVQPSTKQNHLIYLKNMLLTEKGTNIIPDWAIFTKCIINTKDLRPTASREGFFEDETLAKAREDIGTCISNHLKSMARYDNATYQRFLNIHSLAVKSMAIDDDELFELFIDDLEFHTTKGIMTGLELRISNQTLLYAKLDEYRQLAQIFLAQGKLLINASLVYTLPLLNKMQDFFAVKVDEVEIDEVDNMLKPISSTDVEKANNFLTIAKQILEPFGCEVDVKQFIPNNLPAFYYMNENAKLYQEIKQVETNADNIFQEMLSAFAGEIKEQAKSILYFNIKNPIVQKMCNSTDLSLLQEMIPLIYIQTLLIGGFPLKNNELGIMNDKLLNLMDISLI